jgi:radical SAM-linked protein
LKLELRFSVTGRARFLSHLECVDMLLAAFRRAGYEVALSQGMRPKPVISLAVARAVGVAADDEICTVQLVGEHDFDEVRERLDATLPRGIGVHGVAASAGTPRPVAARYRVRSDAPRSLIERAGAALSAADTVLVERRSPKGVKFIDVRKYADGVEVVDGGFEVEVAVSGEGSARPEEVARALEQCVGEPIPVAGLMRLTVRVAEPERAGAAPGDNT